MLNRLLSRWSAGRQNFKDQEAEKRLSGLLAEKRTSLWNRIKERPPRVLVVKQDVNEDLYCCPPDSDHDELIRSTLLRTGPVSLFSELGAEFKILTTVDDPECSIWQERATVLQWDSLQFFSSYRDRVPGRDYGQKRWAIAPEDVNWSDYDIVISMDVSVPARITSQFPNILWCYYVREIKAPAYAASFREPAPGQDIVLNHHFRLTPPRFLPHVLEFPYHVQRPGCFHRLFRKEEPSFSERRGVFVDHHTMIALSADQRNRLRRFGPLSSTVHEGDREVIPTSEQVARRTMDDDLCECLLSSRYFLITPGQRIVFGTAMVEAIAAGCLVIANPESMGAHGFFLTKRTAAANSDAAAELIQYFDSATDVAEAELRRQQELTDYLCFVRPVHQLLDAWQRKLNR